MKKRRFKKQFIKLFAKENQTKTTLNILILSRKLCALNWEWVLKNGTFSWYLSSIENIKNIWRWRKWLISIWHKDPPTTQTFKINYQMMDTLHIQFQMFLPKFQMLTAALHKKPRDPTTSHKIPQDPTISHKIPQYPTTSHKITQHPKKLFIMPQQFKNP
jgi:hypothetical protein